MAAYVLNPDLPPPGGIEAFVATGRVCFSTEAPWEPGAIWHVVSPIELDVPIERQWPRETVRAGMRVIVTVHDLIPERLPDRYLADAGLRRRFRTRLELIRHAHHVFSISECTSRDTVEILGVDPARITMVGSAPAAFFVPATSRAAAAARAAGAVSGLRPPFVLYTGGMDDRKNLEGLLAGWAATSASVRERWQLAIACRASPLERNHYELRAQHHGVGDSVVLTGYVPDDVLLALTQAADLAVFPSLYEGFGLPVVEALACATPVVAANTSCLPELLDPVALFDPLDPHAIARAITRGLTDESYRAELTHASARPISSWDDVADRMAAGYHEVVARPAPAPDRTRPRVAVVAPFPPQRTGVAEWAWLLVDELRELCDVDALADGFHLDHSPPAVPDSVETHPARSLRFVEAARNGYDTVLYNVGNSEFHAGALAELQRRPGTVLAHEVRLVDLFALSADQRGAVPDGFAATVERLYPGVAPPELRGAGRIPHDVAERLGLFMLREIAAHSEQVLVTSEFAAGIARIDAGPDLEDRIGVMPFAIFPPNGGVAPEPPRDAAPVVASFGLVHAVKQPDVLVDAFALVRDSVPAARLAFVGRCSDEQAAAVRAAAQRAGVADAVELTGAVDMEEYAAWLARAAVAVQLRSSSNGESSGAVGNCLSFGVPTIVSAVGPNRELPDSAVRRVPAGVHAPALASAITELLYDDATRRALRAGALRYAAEHTHAVVARWLYDHVIVPATFRYVNQ